MTPSAKMLVAGMRHATSVKPLYMVSAKPSDATSADAADVASTKATDMTSTKATSMASAKAAHAAATMASASAAATGLCAGRKQAAGQRGACQNHYHSSFHDILHFGERIFRSGSLSALGMSR
jgi:hypothetical protein